jgi:two-component system chemotaxis response regulator CheB
MIRILIAEDSPVVAKILGSLFEAEADLEVVGIAADGKEAVRMAATLKPDLITMDVIMPKLDGVAAIERIMEETPTPIVVISSHVNDKEMQVTFRSLAAGALSVLEKPEDVFSPAFETRRRAFLETIRAMAEVKVVRRRIRAQPAPAVEIDADSLPKQGDFRLVALGASTGGPQALHHILRGLPGDYPLPIVVAQHIARGFTKGLVDWLDAFSALHVKLAEDGEALRAGTVYLAPDGRNIGVARAHGEFRARVGPEQPERVLTPSVDQLFHSVADTVGAKAVCGLLTGMGSDGADGLAAVRRGHGYTFAESRESCVVFGMPAAAIERAAVRDVLHVGEVSAHLLSLVGQANRIA